MGGERSVFIDESGDIGSGSEYCIVALILHNQTDKIDESIGRYEGADVGGAPEYSLPC